MYIHTDNIRLGIKVSLLYSLVCSLYPSLSYNQDPGQGKIYYLMQSHPTSLLVISLLNVRLTEFPAELRIIHVLWEHFLLQTNNMFMYVP